MSIGKMEFGAGWIVTYGVLVAFLAFLIIASVCSAKVRKTSASGGSIMTASHDGHLFVIFSGHGGGICHHPDCPKCLPETRGGTQ